MCERCHTFDTHPDHSGIRGGMWLHVQGPIRSLLAQPCRAPLPAIGISVWRLSPDLHVECLVGESHAEWAWASTFELVTEACSLHTTVLACSLGHGQRLLWSAVKFTSMCSAVQCSAMQCSAVQCSAVQCSAVQCSAVQCSAVQCSPW